MVSLAGEKEINNKGITWTLAFFFGWLLSFPFYGPILYEIAPVQQAGTPSLTMLFTMFHALTFFTGGFILNRKIAHRAIMVWSLSACIIVSVLLWFSRPELWPTGISLLGVFSALYILGWSIPYTVGVTGTTRVKTMALIILAANLIYLALRTLATLSFSPLLILAALLGPLFIALWLLLRSPGEVNHAPGQRPRLERTLPFAVLAILSLFIFGLYLNSGLMYSVIHLSMNSPAPFAAIYHYLPYKLILFLIWLLGEKVNLNFWIFLGVSLLGLAFVSFALIDHAPGRYYITETTVQAAFALLDLFCWVVLGKVAAIYSYPARAFGFGLGAMLAGIFAGELIGEQLLLFDKSFTALFAACAIFLTLLIMPWLNERVLKSFQGEITGGLDPEPLGRIMATLPRGRQLTAREAEIVSYLLKGISNKEIARHLFISDNTLKTHLKHIYPKLGVTQKVELLSLALGEREQRETAPE